MIMGVIFPIFCMFYSYDIINNIYNLFNIPKVSGFDTHEKINEDQDTFELNSIHYVNTYNHTNLKIGENDLNSIKGLINNRRVIVVNYSIDDREYLIYYENYKNITFPVYTNYEINKLVFVRKIKYAELIIGDVRKDITEFLLMFFGPNNNFYSDKDICMNVNRVITLGHLLDYISFTEDDEKNLKNEKYIIEVEDNLENIFYFTPMDDFEWNPYINYFNEHF